MTYEEAQNNQIVGTVAFLYSFQYDTKNYSFTDHDVDIISQDILFKATENLSCSKLSNSQEVGKAEFSIFCSKDNEIALLFRNFNPNSIVKVNITQVLVDEPESRYSYFFGDIIGTVIDDDQATITCLPINFLINSKSTRNTYQSYCNNILYGSHCKLKKEDWVFQTVITNIENSGTLLTLEKIQPDWFNKHEKASEFLETGSILTNIGEKQGIAQVYASSKKIQLIAACVELEVGDTAYFYAGCVRNADDCIYKFNNFKNYLGFEFVPGRNNNPFKNL